MRPPADPDLAHDLARALALVDRITSAPDLTAFAWRTCEGILDLVPAISVSYNEVNPAAGRAFAIISPDPGPGWYRTFQPPFEAHLNQHPVIAHQAATGDTRVLIWGDPEVGTVVGTTLDRTFYLPNGIRSQAVMTLPAPPGVLIAIAVNRGAEGFAERDRMLLSLLRPHLVHAYRAVQLRSDVGLLGSMLEEQGWAVVLVDWDGRVVGSTPGLVSAARRYGLDLADGATLTNGLARVADLMRDYDPRTPAAVSGPWRLTGPAGTLEAMVVPSVVGPHVLFLRSRAGTRSALIAAGLTPRQAEVAMELADGRTNAEIARKLGIAGATVKKHLEGIFARLEVTHRAAAVARIVDLR
jgi:DNA-binding CsgD family transcriptional regulator